MSPDSGREPANILAGKGPFGEQLAKIGVVMTHSGVSPKKNYGNTLKDLLKQFRELGWCRFPHDPKIADWVESALPAATASRFDPAFTDWMRCGETWFAGVNALPNDGSGAVEGGVPLAGAAVEFLAEQLGIAVDTWDAGQVSICYPGYPQKMDRETDGGYRYRVERFASHIDGILPEGPDRRRHLREHHQFVLGVPITDYNEQASPVVAWEGSHHVVKAVLSDAFGALPVEKWGDTDITDVYHALRNRIFEECKPVQIVARPGETYLIHRLALHGIAPWGDGARADERGRIICYFRPETSSPEKWLYDP